MQHALDQVLVFVWRSARVSESPKLTPLLSLCLSLSLPLPFFPFRTASGRLCRRFETSLQTSRWMELSLLQSCTILHSLSKRHIGPSCSSGYATPFLVRSPSHSRTMSSLQEDVDHILQAAGGDRVDSGLVPKAKARAERHKARAGKGMRYCRACNQYKKETEFAMNQAHDNECKRVLDALAGQARRQGPAALEWLAKTKADPKALQEMVASYKKASDEAKQLGVRRVRWNIVTYMEEIQSTTGVEYVEEGEMMWRKQALRFWQSPEGGSMSDEDATLEWARLSSNIESLGLITDQRGPPKEPLRIRVKTSDKVNFKNAHSRKRKILMEEKGLKKCEDEDIDRLTKRTLANHDKIGTGSSDVDLAGLAQGMVTGGAGEAFNNFNMNIQDITKLVQEIVVKEEQEDGDAEDAEVAEPGKKRAKVPWFDRDRSVNAASRAAQKQIDKVKHVFRKVIDALGQAITQVEQLPASEQVHYAGELKIARVRLTTMQKLEGTEDDLRAHLCSFKQGLQPSPKKLASSSDGGLGNAPPCGQYEGLVLLSYLDVQIQAFQEVQTKDDITLIKKKLSDLKGPIADLISCSNAALADINKVKKALNSEGKEKEGKQNKGKAAAAAKAANGQGAASQIFDLAPSCAGAVPTVQYGQDKVTDFSKPCFISLSPDEHKAFINKTKDTLDEFCKNLAENPDVKRAEQPLTEGPAECVLDMCGKIFEAGIVTSCDPGADVDLQQICKLLGVVSYGIKRGGPETFALEKGGLPSLRIPRSGTRSLVLTPYSHVIEYLSKVTSVEVCEIVLKSPHRWIC